LSLFSGSDLAIEGQKLERSLYKRDIRSKDKVKEIFTLTHDAVAVRVPDISDDNPGLISNLGRILSFILRTFNIKRENLRILKDPDVGKTFNLSAKIARNLDILESSLTMSANKAGEAYEFQTGLKANLPEILAALRVARRNSGLIRNADLKRKTIRTSPDILRKMFNMKFGFEEPSFDPWVVSLLKRVFNELVQSTNAFPGEWMHSLRITNNTNNDVGIINLMGYEAINLAPIKVKSVLLTLVVNERILVPPKSNKGKPVIGQGTVTEREVLKPFSKDIQPNLDYREYRTAVVSLLPFIDPKSKSTFKEQLSKGALDPITKENLEFFKSNSELVKSCNLAFALKSSLSNKKSKTNPSHFKMGRNRFISSSANIPFQDATGKIYQKYVEIPKNIREFLENIFFHKVDEIELKEKYTLRVENPDLFKRKKLESSIENSSIENNQISSNIKSNLAGPSNIGGKPSLQPNSDTIQKKGKDIALDGYPIIPKTNIIKLVLGNPQGLYAFEKGKTPSIVKKYFESQLSDNEIRQFLTDISLNKDIAIYMLFVIGRACNMSVSNILKYFKEQQYITFVDSIDWSKQNNLDQYEDPLSNL